MALLVAGFAGVGKTYMSEKYGGIVFDPDVDIFKYRGDDHTSEVEGWIEAYGEYVQNLAMQEAYVIVVCPTDAEIIAEIERREIPYTVAVPDKSLKDEYSKRYADCKYDEATISSILDNWDTRIDELMAHEDKIVLQSGEYLSDYYEPLYDRCFKEVRESMERRIKEEMEKAKEAENATEATDSE